VQRFSEEAERNAPDEEQLLEAKIAFQRSLLQELFDFRLLKKRFERVRRVLLEHEHKLLPGALEPFQPIMDFAEQELYPVARRFQGQLQQYFKEGGLPVEHQGLQDRAKQAAAWFARQLKDGCLKPLEDVNVVTDNQKVESEVAEALEQLREEAFTKRKALLQTESGFSPNRLTKVKTDAALDYQQEQAKRSKPDTPQLSPDTVAHPELFQRLAAWRRAKGEERGVPLYQILPNKSLLDIAQVLPDSPVRLKQAHGIGKKRMEQFGEELLAIVAAYCEETGAKPAPAPDPAIARPAKRKAPTSNTREKTLALYRAGKSIPQIATERGLVKTTIEGHIADLIEQGKLSATEFLMPQAIQIIKQQALSMSDGSLKALHQHFGGVYSYGQLRMALAEPDKEGKYGGVEQYFTGKPPVDLLAELKKVEPPLRKG